MPCRKNINKIKLIFSLIFIFYIFLYDFAYPDDSIKLSTFGKGKVAIRLYADYFCGPCSYLETQLENLLKPLIEQDIITITFIDVPFHRYSSMYVKYFLYALNEKKTLEYAFKVRTTLFNAAKEKITDAQQLENYLKSNKIKFKPFDERGVYQIFEKYLNSEDKINATPSCVIINDGRKEIFKGANDIINALKRLM